MNGGEPLLVQSVYEIVFIAIVGAADNIQVPSSIFEYRSGALKPIRLAKGCDTAARELGGSPISRSQPQISVAVFRKSLHIFGTYPMRLCVTAKSKIPPVSG